MDKSLSRRRLLEAGTGISLFTAFNLTACRSADAGGPSTSPVSTTPAPQVTRTITATVSAAPTATDFAALRSKWAVMQTGAGHYSSTTAPYTAFVAGIDAEVQGWYSTISTNPTSSGYLWNDVLSGSDEVNTRVSFDRLRIMAIAYKTGGSTYLNNASLLSTIASSLQFLSTSRYNTSVAKTGNWWEWEIGVPLALLDTVIVLNGLINSGLVSDLMAAIYRFSPSPNMTAANLVWKCRIVLLRAIVVEDATKFQSALTSLATTYPYVTTGDGFYADGSFVQHADFAYTGAYGLSMLFSAADMLYLVAGTSQAQTTDSWAQVRTWVYQSFEPLMYRGAMMDMTLGRAISRAYSQDIAVGQQVAAAVCLLAEIAPSSDAAAFKSMVKYWASANSAVRSIFVYDPLSKISIDIIRLIKAYKDSTTITSRGELVNNYQLPAMDRFVHKRPDFGFALATYSDLISTYESVNNENLHGWYTGSGMTYLYNLDIGHYQNDFWPTVDPYRLPGTTIDKRTLTNGQYQNTKGHAYVGGASSGSSGMATMLLSAYSGDLVGKKTWFMFGDYILCAGSRITDTSANVVETIVENRNVGDATGGLNDVYFNNTSTKILTTLGATQTLASPSWVNIAGVGGYVFLGGNPTLKALRERRSGTWLSINNRASSPTDTRTRTYVTLWLDHGTSPSASTYAYVIMPGATAAETASYASAPAISLLENSGNAQYAKGIFSGSVVYGAVFWLNSSYTVDIMTCNAIACVFIRTTGTQIEIAISDPSQVRTTAMTLQVALANSSIQSTDAGISVSRTATTATITFDPTSTKGQSRVAVLNV